MYTDRRKRPLGAVSGHLCTLSQRGTLASSRWGHNSVHRLAKTVFRRRSGPFVYTIAPQAAPRVAPQAAPRVAPQAAPRVALRAAPRVTLRATPRVAPQAAPRVALRAASRVTLRATPRVALRAASRVTPQAAPRAASDDTSASTPWCAGGALSVAASPLVEKTGSLRPAASGLLVLVHERAKHALGLSQLPTKRFGALGDGPRDLGVHLLGDL